MILKLKEKEKAISLRKRGFSYSEILKQIRVAKSTLSLWLKSVGLSKPQKQRLTLKRIQAALRGAATRKRECLVATRAIYQESVDQIHDISLRELWFMGIMLYWAEGAKEKVYKPGIGLKFTNSDAEMVKLFLKWLLRICGVKKSDIYFSIIIHENHRKNTQRFIHYWSKAVGLPIFYFPYIYYKKPKEGTKRKNIGKNYYGVVQLRVRKSSGLNRKITGWIKGILRAVLRGGAIGNTPAFEAGIPGSSPGPAEVKYVKL